MRQQIVTKAIVLARTDFQEADRILMLLTPDHGKLKVIAKGVRRPRSKLAGGIELLSINDVTVLPGRGEIGTLISSRLVEHFNHIVKDIQRTMLAYELIKQTNRVTEDTYEPVYFDLVEQSLRGLDDPEVAIELTELWFIMQLLQLGGHTPNLLTDTGGQKLDEAASYVFDFESMAFAVTEDAPYQARHIKLLRVCLGAKSPVVLKKLGGADGVAPDTLKLAKLLLQETS